MNCTTRARSTAASRSAQHGGLAVHAAAGADHGVGAGHEPAAVERLAAPQECAETGGLQVGGLGPPCAPEGSSSPARLPVAPGAQGTRGTETVVQRQVGGRPDHQGRARGVDAGAPQVAGVGREAGQGDVLLEAGVAPGPPRPRALCKQAVQRKHLGRRHQIGAAEGQVVGRLVLVVHGGHHREAERARGRGLRAGAVAHGHVRVRAPGQAAEPSRSGYSAAMRYTVRNSVSQWRPSWHCFAPRSTSVP